MFEDAQTGQCGVSSGEKDRGTWVVIHPLFLLYHLLDLALDLIQPTTLDPTHHHSGVLPPLC